MFCYFTWNNYTHYGIIMLTIVAISFFVVNIVVDKIKQKKYQN